MRRPKHYDRRDETSPQRRWLGATAAAALLGGCARQGVLAPAGPIAAANRTILLNSLTIMLAIVVPTIILNLVFAWWFREGNTRAKRQPDFVYSGRVELIVWSVPILTVLFLSGVIWVGSHDLDPSVPIKSRQKPIEVQVVSLDWKWLFIYPQQGIASVNRLVMPVGVPVHFSMTSASVLNTFYIPQLGSQVYTMSGMASELNLQADRSGLYYGVSGHFSGDGFSDMDFPVNAVSPAQFAGWVSQARGKGQSLDARTYPQLARQSTRVTPITFRAVQPGLFGDITSQRLLPAPGPTTGRGGDASISSGDES